MWIRNVILTCLFLLIFPLQSHADPTPERLVIGTSEEDYPPYHWTVNGNEVGLVPDMIRALANKLGIKEVTFVQLPWQRMLKMAELGKVDAVTPLFRTEERQAFLDFPEENLILESVGFYTREGSDIVYDGQLENMLSHVIGTINGYSYGAEFDALDFKRIDTANEIFLFKMLKAGRYEVGISDTRVLEYYSKSLDFKPVVLEPLVVVEPLFMAFSKKKNFGDLIERFSKELSALKNSEEYKAILALYELTG